MSLDLIECRAFVRFAAYKPNFCVQPFFGKIERIVDFSAFHAHLFRASDWLANQSARYLMAISNYPIMRACAFFARVRMNSLLYRNSFVCVVSPRAKPLFCFYSTY